MKYVALLRGINVGGNSLIKMSELKVAFEEVGHAEVKTYINSGNVIFVSDETSIAKLEDQLQTMVLKVFKLNIKVLVKSHEQMQQIIASVPKDWNSKEDIRCYVGFLFDDVTDEEIKGIPVRKDIDFLKVAHRVLYMTTLVSGLTKSGFTKMAGTTIYKKVTIRNYNSAKKILALMDAA